MARTTFYRKENGQQITVGMAVMYIKDSGAWRETKKAEMDVMGIQSPVRSDVMPMTIGVEFPVAENGEDGDYYALLYPVGWEGEVWSSAR